MIKAVLLDLDNTLLHNPDVAFASRFAQLWDQHFSAHGISDGVSLLRKSIQQATNGQIHTRSIHTQLLKIIVSDTGKTEQYCEQLIADFYGSFYNELHPCIQPVQGALELIHALEELNLAVVIATNPIYPESAVMKRLKWAGLPDQSDAYAFVTSSENMHYAKPDPAYYAEIVARVGVEPDEALIIGDSSTNDIEPARQIGLRTYHVKAAGVGWDERHRALLLRKIDNPAWQHVMTSDDYRPEMLNPQYRGNVAAIYGLLDSTTPQHWHQRPVASEWSIIQIVCHLVNVESTVHRSRLSRIIREDNPFIAALPAPGPDIPECTDNPYDAAEQFVSERTQTMALLSELTDADYNRPARHSIFGITNLIEMAHFTAQHDRLHINQMCQTIGRCE